MTVATFTTPNTMHADMIITTVRRLCDKLGYTYTQHLPTPDPEPDADLYREELHFEISNDWMLADVKADKGDYLYTATYPYNTEIEQRYMNYEELMYHLFT